MKIEMKKSVTGANDAVAATLRQALTRQGILCINLISAPGSGKTALIEKILETLSPTFQIAVIEGDPHTELDSQRVRAAGARAVQINTLGGCHLDAAMVEKALASLGLIRTPEETPDPVGPRQNSGRQDPNRQNPSRQKPNRQGPGRPGLVIIENVGNLLCPAPWDLGEHLRVVISSLPEGADKPLKYPETFLNAQALVINKIDLEGALKTKVTDIRKAALTINPGLEVFALSCETGEGIAHWCGWLEGKLLEPKHGAWG